MKDYCDNETSRELKELGFPTKVTFIGEQATIEIPINSGWIHLYEAQKFLREEKQVEVVILSRGMIGAPYYFQVYTEDYLSIADRDYASYEEALSEGIKEAVKILKEK